MVVRGVGGGVADNTLLHVARLLPTAKDPLRLQLANECFGTKVIAAPMKLDGREQATMESPSSSDGSWICSQRADPDPSSHPLLVLHSVTHHTCRSSWASYAALCVFANGMEPPLKNI